jgi:hypothetical protein
VKNTTGGIINPLVNDSCAHVVHASVVVVLHPLGHLSELQRLFREESKVI